ncbi:MAG: hypothetical protein HY211_00360 [Candidatus Omnitrophica bacterium]|nr:hypothetical protein [Candidatus Omnitrophota bacterium]
MSPAPPEYALGRGGVDSLRSKDLLQVFYGKGDLLEWETAEGICAFGTAFPSLQGWKRDSGGAG